MATYVKGKRRNLVLAVRDAADQVLSAKDYAEAYMAFAQLGQAVEEFEAHLADVFAKPVTS